MTRVYKLRIYPKPKQQDLIQKTFKAVQYVYNYFLNRRTEEHKRGHNLTFCQCSKELTSLKQSESWLQEPDKWALCNALRDLDQAFENFFKKIKRYPVPKNGRVHTCYRTTQSNKTIQINNHYIRLPKLGWIRFRDKQIVTGEIVHAKVTQDVSGRYFVAVCCRNVSTEPIAKTGKVVGIDVGLRNLVTLSNGVTYENPLYYKKLSKKISKAKSMLDRRKHNGYRYERARIKFARLWCKVSDQRKDFLSKLTTKFIQDFDIICHETLFVKQTRSRQKTPVRRIQEDASWYTFFRMLEYKALWYDKQIVKVDQYFPSSQLCSQCGERYPEMKDLEHKEMNCSKCGLVLDRDLNAAINIREEGLRLLKSQ